MIMVLIMKGILDGNVFIIERILWNIVTTAPIKTDKEFKEHLNVWVKRPGSGIPSYELPNIVGKRASRNLPANYLLKPEDIVD